MESSTKRLAAFLQLACNASSHAGTRPVESACLSLQTALGLLVICGPNDLVEVDPQCADLFWEVLSSTSRHSQVRVCALENASLTSVCTGYNTHKAQW